VLLRYAGFQRKPQLAQPTHAAPGLEHAAEFSASGWYALGHDEAGKGGLRRLCEAAGWTGNFRWAPEGVGLERGPLGYHGEAKPSVTRPGHAFTGRGVASHPLGQAVPAGNLAA
jgi:hypothetical protein